MNIFHIATYRQTRPGNRYTECFDNFDDAKDFADTNFSDAREEVLYKPFSYANVEKIYTDLSLDEVRKLVKDRDLSNESIYRVNIYDAAREYILDARNYVRNEEIRHENYLVFNVRYKSNSRTERLGPVDEETIKYIDKLVKKEEENEMYLEEFWDELNYIVAPIKEKEVLSYELEYLDNIIESLENSNAAIIKEEGVYSITEPEFEKLNIKSTDNYDKIQFLQDVADDINNKIIDIQKKTTNREKNVFIHQNGHEYKILMQIDRDYLLQNINTKDYVIAVKVDELSKTWRHGIYYGNSAEQLALASVNFAERFSDREYDFGEKIIGSLSYEEIFTGIMDFEHDRFKELTDEDKHELFDKYLDNDYYNGLISSDLRVNIDAKLDKLATLKECIIEYQNAEFDKDLSMANFDDEFPDYKDISLAYTTTENEKHEIRVSLDLENLVANQFLDDKIIDTIDFKAQNNREDAIHQMEEFVSLAKFEDLIVIEVSYDDVLKKTGINLEKEDAADYDKLMNYMEQKQGFTRKADNVINENTKGIKR